MHGTGEIEAIQNVNLKIKYFLERTGVDEMVIWKWTVVRMANDISRAAQ
jgi:hypothetical protein